MEFLWKIYLQCMWKIYERLSHKEDIIVLQGNSWKAINMGIWASWRAIIWTCRLQGEYLHGKCGTLYWNYLASGQKQEQSSRCHHTHCRPFKSGWTIHHIGILTVGRLIASWLFVAILLSFSSVLWLFEVLLGWKIGEYTMCALFLLLIHLYSASFFIITMCNKEHDEKSVYVLQIIACPMDV